MENIGSLDIKDRIIRDPKRIERYDKIFNYEFFVHPNDKKLIDQDVVLGQMHIESQKVVGKLSTIKIAINEDDPYWKTDSEYRIMGRPFDGTHRYLQTSTPSANAGMTNSKWDIEYVDIKDFDEFCIFFHHYNAQKAEHVRASQMKRKLLIECHYLYDVQKITPKEKIGRILVKKYGFNHPYATSTIYKNLPQGFTNTYEKKLKKNLGKEKHISKKDIHITKLETEITSLQKEVFSTQDRLTETKSELETIKEQNIRLLSENSDLKERNRNLEKLIDKQKRRMIA